MTRLTIDLTMSLGGYVAGPDPSQQDPLGVGGERLHEWAFAASSWQEQHGHEGGEAGADADVIQEHLDAIGAAIMGRKMYSGGTGGWEDDPNPRGWWGDTPPFGHPVFVLTHQAREPLEMEGGTTFHFVTDGIEAALERAREAAGGKDVHVAGGGTRLFEGLSDPPGLEIDRVVASPAVTHLRYRVAS